MRRFNDTVAKLESLLEGTAITTAKSGFEGEDDKGELRAGDVARIQDADGPADKAEDGKAWVVVWAGGRGVTAFNSRSKMMEWAKGQGEWAEIVSVKYGDPVYGKETVKVNESDAKHPDYMEGFHHGYAGGNPQFRKYKNKEKYGSNDQYRKGYDDGKVKAKEVWDRGSVYESFDPTKGAFRTKGGKFASLKKNHGAQWTPHVPKKVKATVESLGGKVKAWSSGGGLALVFEDLEKCEAAFVALRETGHRIIKHDIPGVLHYQGMLGESVVEGNAQIALKASEFNPMHRAALLNALINKGDVDPGVTEDFSQVFSDEEKAEAAAVNLAQSHNREWAVICVDDDEDDHIEYLAIPSDDAFERIAVDPAASMHAMFDATGKQITDLDDDTKWNGLDEAAVHAMTERHSMLSRLGNEMARKKLAGGMRRRMRSARRSARNRLRRGFIYQAKAKARSALHRPGG
jgi:hypothetical protein